ncbi:hypothetical protein ABT263_35570 [Kitasatospora sp. NPDC001603]|uniref:hypothetical protein n=1 Tax=Kitasatospora sp. NPDC001603 TaxID=3154388 RepID=UPI00332426F0
MKISKSLAAVSLATLAVLGGTALPAHAEALGSQDSVSITANSPRVSVHYDNGANGLQVAAAISGIKEGNRGKFVQRVVDTAFNVSGGRFNVVVMNLSQNYQERLSDKRLYANIQWGNIYYGLWIAEEGEFTNAGDAGWINWGYRGWIDRSGNTIHLHRG